MRVGDLLSRCPEFAFDIIEHLQATQHADGLLRRLHRTQTWMADCTAPATNYHGPFLQFDPGSEYNSTISKDDLRTDISRYIDFSACREDAWGKWTSGTTGSPILIPYAPEFYFDQLYLPLIRAAIFVGEELVVRDGVFSIGLTDNPSSSEFVVSDPTGTVGLAVQILVQESAYESIERLWKLIDQLRPAVLSMKPVIIETLLTSPSRPRADLDSLRFVFCSGSTLRMDIKQEAETLFGAPLVNGYGLTEFGMMGFECAHGSIHYDPAVFRTETVTADGDAASDGEPGIVLVTTRTNPLLPLWRYNTGDVAVATNSSCACARMGPTLTQLEGRIQSCFRGRNGELMSPIHFGRLFNILPIREYQVIQDNPGNLRVLLEPLATAAGDNLDLAGNAREHIRQMIPSTWDVTIEEAILADGRGFQRHIVNHDAAVDSFDARSAARRQKSAEPLHGP